MSANQSRALSKLDDNHQLVPADLDSVLAAIWLQLEKGAQRSVEPFHLGVLATGGTDGPSLRTIVLRAVYPEQRVLLCHTDVRSEKLAAIRRDDRVAWLFYDAERKLQLRLRGRAAVRADDSLAARQWRRTRLAARRCYLAEHGPGTPIPTDNSGLSPAYDTHPPTWNESEQGWDNFSVVACQIQHIDWLRLSARGHQRARFLWQGAQWEGAWIAP